MYFIANCNFPARHFHHDSSAENFCIWCGKLFQAVERMLRFNCLNRSQNGIHGNNYKDNNCTFCFSKEKRYSCGTDKNNYKEILKLLQKNLKSALFLSFYQLVKAIFFLIFSYSGIAERFHSPIDLFSHIFRALTVIRFHRHFPFFKSIFISEKCKIKRDFYCISSCNKSLAVSSRYGQIFICRD